MFEAIYAGAEAGGAKPPWDYGAPRPQLVEWAEAQNLAGGGREALVVGCGYGADAEFLALLGFRTTGFDFAPTAIAAARRKYPDSEVNYLVADVLDLPREWQGRFDLVVESLTVQSMPPEQHTVAAQNIAALVAPEGTLLVLATTRDEGLRGEGTAVAADPCRARGVCERRPRPAPTRADRERRLVASRTHSRAEGSSEALALDRGPCYPESFAAVGRTFANSRDASRWRPGRRDRSMFGIPEPWDGKRAGGWHMVGESRIIQGGQHVCSNISGTGSPEALQAWEDNVDGVAAMIRGLSGVAGAMFFIDRSQGDAMTLTLWEDEEAALASDEHAEVSRSATIAATGVELVGRGRYEVVAKL